MRARSTAVLAVAALLLVGCGDDADPGESGEAPTTTAADTTPTDAPTTTAAATYEPVAVDAPCDDQVPADPRVECGVLTVPVDRADPAAGDVTIPYAIVHSSSPTPEPDPIVYFSGGPGGDGRGIADFFLEEDIGGPRDMIVFDQRGTGASTPSLDCVEYDELVWTLLGAAEPPADERQLAIDALATCRARLVADGVDLDAYDTPTTAADVEDLRIALGIEEWNIFGISYGTTVALEVARTYPEHVRSVVLDSVYPPDDPTDAQAVVDQASRVLGVLFDGCAADPACASAHGDIEASLLALRDAWNADPFEATVDDPATGQPRAIVVTGDDVVAGLWNAMYDSDLIPLLPSLLQPLLDRTDLATTVVQQLATDGIDQLAGSAEGIGMAVDCADRQRLSADRPSTEEVLAAEPLYASLLALGGLRECAVWEVASVDASFNEPVVSDLPALILAGEYDPVTPPADSERAAAGFSAGTYVLLPGLGHGAIFPRDCGRSLFAAFLADPTAELDTSCAAALGPPAFAA